MANASQSPEDQEQKLAIQQEVGDGWHSDASSDYCFRAPKILHLHLSGRHIGILHADRYTFQNSHYAVNSLSTLTSFLLLQLSPRFQDHLFPSPLQQRLSLSLIIAPHLSSTSRSIIHSCRRF